MILQNSTSLALNTLNALIPRSHSLIIEVAYSLGDVVSQQVLRSH